MERIKFEENSREKFEEREIQPSEGAWLKLEAMLDDVQPQKKKRSFNWLAIAASFIGFVIIASIFYNQTGNEESIVIEEEASEILNNKTNNTPFKAVQELKNENEAVAETLNSKEDLIERDNNVLNVSDTSRNNIAKTKEETKENKKQATDRNKLIQKTQQVQSPKRELAMVKTKDDTSTVSEEKKNILGTAQIAPQKELLAIAEVTQGTIKKSTKDDIDTLLLRAQLDIRKEQLLKLKSNKVDAMALLNSVELEQYQSLRKKMFYALGDGIDYLTQNVVGTGN